MERIPFDLSQTDLTDPTSRTLYDYATQPPAGCRYVDTSSTTTTCATDTATTLDLLSTGGNVKYDPYNMVSVASNHIVIPFPGVWDVSYVVLVTNVAASTTYVDVQFMQGTGTPSGLAELGYTYHPAATADYATMALADTYYVARATLGAGSLWYMRAYSAAAANEVKIVSLSLWLRSAAIPGKY